MSVYGVSAVVAVISSYFFLCHIFVVYGVGNVMYLCAKIREKVEIANAKIRKIQTLQSTRRNGRVRLGNYTCEVDEVLQSKLQSSLQKSGNFFRGAIFYLIITPNSKLFS